MANISINIAELKDILDRTPASQNIMLSGRHGIGKSEILTQYFESKGMKVVTLFLGQMSDPGDLIGLPHKNEQTGKTDFMPPYWFPMDEQPVALFLDELNRARPEVLQTIMDLALNRRLAGRTLPEGSRLISAVNDGDEYQLTDLDPALVSRFNIYAFKPSTEEWLLWASQKKMDERVIGFIQANPLLLDGTDSQQTADSGLDKTPDRRAWKKVSDIILHRDNLEQVDKKIIAGVVGPQATAKFFAFVTEHNGLSGKDILTQFDKASVILQKYAVHQLSGTNESVLRYLETKDYKKKDVAKIASNLKSYVELIGNKNEAMAHFASLFGKGTYPNAMTFIMSETPEIYQNILNFISNL